MWLSNCRWSCTGGNRTRSATAAEPGRHGTHLLWRSAARTRRGSADSPPRREPLHLGRTGVKCIAHWDQMRGSLPEAVSRELFEMRCSCLILMGGADTWAALQVWGAEPATRKPRARALRLQRGSARRKRKTFGGWSLGTETLRAHARGVTEAECACTPPCYLKSDSTKMGARKGLTGAQSVGLRRSRALRLEKGSNPLQEGPTTGRLGDQAGAACSLHTSREGKEEAEGERLALSRRLW